MKYTMRILPILALLLIPVQPQAQPANSASPTNTAAAQFQRCVIRVFQNVVHSESDKEKIFSEAFPACKKAEEAMEAALRNDGRSQAEIDGFKSSLRNDTKERLLAMHQKQLDDLLWQAAYVMEISACPDANIPFLVRLKDDVTTSAYHSDATLHLHGLATPRIEYHRILLRTKQNQVGRAQWCQSERSYLDGKGSNSFFLKK